MFGQPPQQPPGPPGQPPQQPGPPSYPPQQQPPPGFPPQAPAPGMPSYPPQQPPPGMPAYPQPTAPGGYPPNPAAQPQYPQPSQYAPQAPQAPNAGIFAGIEQANASMDGNYIRPGTYITQIVRCKDGTSQMNGPFFAVEQKVMVVLDPGANDPGGLPPHSVGEEMTEMMMKKYPSFLGNVKAFVSNALGCNPDQVSMQMLGQIISDQQPMANMFVEVFGHTIRTRSGGNFTKTSYRRRVPASEVAHMLRQQDPTGALTARLFPNGALDALIAHEASMGIGAAPAPAAPQPQAPQPQAYAPQPAAQPPYQPAAPAQEPAQPQWTPGQFPGQ